MLRSRPSMAKKKSLNRAELQSKERISIHRTTALVDVTRTLFRCGVIFGVFYFGFDCLKAYAGKESSATMEFMATIVTKISADQWIAYIVAILCGGYGYGERKFRQHKTKELAVRNAYLESLIDTRRSSSGLQKTGETRKGD